MPAGFNKGQVEYIKAIASVNDHKTYKPIVWPVTQNLTQSNDLSKTHNTTLKYRLWTLGQRPYTRNDAGAIARYAAADMEELDAFNIPKTTDSDGTVGAQIREGDEGFLESTHLRLRCILPTDDTSGDLSVLHGEYRIIVFRARDTQSHVLEHTKDQANLFFNLFRGIQNYNIGFSGYESKEGIQGTVDYVPYSAPTGYDQYFVSHDGAMTLPVNREAWVVMKDHRFFLGKEYGGKNIYETTLHWDWRDPIATASDDITESNPDKNYNWHVLIMGTTNNLDGTADARLVVKMTGTTHMTSG